MESIKDRRERMGLTQKELADRVGKHFSHICHIERGNADPSFEVCVRLTEALDVSPNKLFEMLKMRTTAASVTDIQKARERKKRR